MSSRARAATRGERLHDRAVLFAPRTETMSNLTFEKRLLKEHTPEPLEGHTVVVFERVGEAGERFHGILPPGATLAKARGIRAMFRPQVHYFAVAVNAAPELHHEFREHVVLDDEAGHRLYLRFDLSFAAGDPRVLAGRRDEDPLRRVRQRVGQLLARDVSQLDWTEVLYGFAATARALADQRLAELRAFAAGYGIALRGVELKKHLAEETVAPARASADALEQIGRDERMAIAREESERRVRDAASLQLLGGAELDAAAQDARDAARLRALRVEGEVHAIGAVAAATCSRDEYDAVFSPPRHEGGDCGTPAGGRRELQAGPGESGRRLPSGPGGGLGQLLHQVVLATRNIRGTSKRQELRAALLHLLAEVQRDELSDPALLARHADHAGQLLTTLGPGLLPEELDTLRALASPDHLQSHLAG